MNRKLARECAYKLIFGYVFTKERDMETMLDFAKEPTLSVEDKAYMAEVYDNVIENYDELINIIANLAIGFELKRIYKPDLAVLMLAIYEMKYLSDVPNEVAINEAVNICKKYSTQKSSSFVNGILASFYKELKDKTEKEV